MIDSVLSSLGNTQYLMNPTLKTLLTFSFQLSAELFAQPIVVQIPELLPGCQRTKCAIRHHSEGHGNDEFENSALRYIQDKY